MRENAFKEVFLFAFHSVAKEQSFQPMSPGVGLQGGQTGPDSIGRVNSPADRRFFNPISDKGKVFIAETKPASQDARPKQSKDLWSLLAAPR